MDETKIDARISKRVVLHFPGFEPLDASEHRERYSRTLAATAGLWDFSATAGELSMTNGVGRFDVVGEGRGWRTETRVHVFDHDWLVERLAERPLPVRIVRGFLSAARVVAEGGMTGYFRHAWRFGLFFVFPFLMVALALAASLAIASYPRWLDLPAWHYLPGVALAFLFFRYLFLPFSARFHVMHLFSDWEMAVAVAALDRADLRDWLEVCAAQARAAFEEDAEEYLVTSHSMGSNVAVHVIGMLLEREPGLLEGKRIVFATLGGAVLQCALMRCADRLRARVGLIARAPQITWFEVQCLTDAVNFYRSRVAALTGHPDAPQPKILLIRIRNALLPERYRRIKWNLLRVHRQYVLASDRRTDFDFTLMTAGPLPAAIFADGLRDLPSVTDFTAAAGDARP
ncbi:hypothetical protein M8R20_05750 [Pseudomonas sp. R2.Fl]|nr:hypothetical protein [Pseudomonas sp. R2.Fl]